MALPRTVFETIKAQRATSNIVVILDEGAVISGKITEITDQYLALELNSEVSYVDPAAIKATRVLP